MNQTKTLFTDSSCEYFTEDSLNNVLIEEQSHLNLNCGSPNESGLLSPRWTFVAYWCNKFDRLSSFLGQLRVKPRIVGISETWLDDCYHFSDIAGYK